jgi:hypothetical protein
MTEQDTSVPYSAYPDSGRDYPSPVDGPAKVVLSDALA